VRGQLKVMEHTLKKFKWLTGTPLSMLSLYHEDSGQECSSSQAQFSPKNFS
jgi:hypothetical protein